MNKLNSTNKLIFINFLFIPIIAFLKISIGIYAYFIYEFIIMFFIINNYSVIKGIKFKKVILIFLFLSFYCIVSLLKYMNYVYNWIGMVFLLLIYSFQWFVIASSNENWNELVDFLQKNKFTLLLLNICLILYEYFTGRSMIGNMEISYSLLPVAIISAYELLNSNTKKNIFYLILTTLLIIIAGSRGTLLCIFAFIILYSILRSRVKTKILILFLLLTSAFVLLKTDSLLIFNNFLKENNVHSRTLDKLLEGSITTDSGRGKIQKVTIEELNNNLITGVGIAGERIKINYEIYNMAKDMSSCYPHNIILEIYVHYGIIVGTIIIFLIVISSIKAYIKGNKKEKDLLIILLCMEIIRLFISSSYTMSSLFFLYLGLVYSILRRKKNENSNNISK